MIKTSAGSRNRSGVKGVEGYVVKSIVDVCHIKNIVHEFDDNQLNA